MSGRPHPSTRALRDQIISAVRELQATVGAPSTRRIAEAIGVTAWACYAQVYPQLRALERAGIVERVHKPDYRDVFWCYLDTASDAALNKLLGA